jgi:hypothetical protein
MSSIYIIIPTLFGISLALMLHSIMRVGNEKEINVELRHAGNQPIPEFYDDRGDKKMISFKISEKSTVGEVKDEIAKRVRWVDRSISLFNAPFGKKLHNSSNIKDEFIRQQNQKKVGNSSDPADHITDDAMNLFIVIPNY